MSDILVIKANVALGAKQYEKFVQTFTEQKAKGTVLLPCGFEAIVVPDDVEIKVERNGLNGDEEDILNICDRCGNNYETYNTEDNYDNTNAIMLLNMDDENRYYIHEPKDLCPDCMKSFRKWLAND